MKLHSSFLGVLREQSEVVPGNVYPAKGGSKSPGTEYWLVLACSKNGAHCIGFDAEGNPISTANYLRGALRERPLLGRANIDAITLSPQGNEDGQRTD
jgi:hypothetical protein